MDDRTYHADRLINRQIENEFRKLNSILTDEEDKPAIIERIGALRAMLNAPSTETETQQPDISLRQVAHNLVESWKRLKQT